MQLSPLLWLAAIELIGVAALPLAHRILGQLPDRGYASAKILGLIVVAYVAWSTSILGLTAFSGATIAALVVGMGVLSWRLWGNRVRSSWAEAQPLIVAAEATFLVVFLLAVWIRSYNGAIGGTEQPMDLTFLQALIRAQSLPAEDLWLAGYGLPYYHFGYLTLSLIAKVAAVDPAIAYNLSVATVLALAAIGGFGLVAGLARLSGTGTRVASALGGVAAFTLTVMGNLQAFVELLASQGLGSQAFWTQLGVKTVQSPATGFPPSDQTWWFRAARVIPERYVSPDGITEFPYFSFLLGDLHPHYMAIPLGVLVITLATGALASGPANTKDWLRVAVTAIVLGAVIPSNTWDVPVLWGLFGLAFLAAVLPLMVSAPRAVAVETSAADAEGPSLNDGPNTLRRLRDRALQLGMIVGLAVLLYVPYFAGYSAQPLGLDLVAGERTPLGTLLVLFGPLLVLPAAAGVIAIVRREAGASTIERLVALGGVALGGILMLLGQVSVGLLVATLACWLVLAWARCRSGESVPAAMTALLVVVGLGSILVPEIIFLRDAFASRMNTVFKFYYDAWILLALAAPLLALELISEVRAVSAEARTATRGKSAESPARALLRWTGRFAAGGALAVAVLLAVAGAIYPLAATHTRSAGFVAGRSLDGMASLRSFRPDDAAAVEWLRTTHPGVGIVEAVGRQYSSGGRIATFAGAPTLLGWAGHETQWRGPFAETNRREEIARLVYTSPNIDEWSRELNRLDLRFIVLGDLERETYRLTVPAPFEERLPVAARFGRTQIYEVPRQGVAG